MLNKKDFLKHASKLAFPIMIQKSKKSFPFADIFSIVQPYLSLFRFCDTLDLWGFLSISSNTEACG